MRRRLVGLFAIGFTLGTAVDGLAQARYQPTVAGWRTLRINPGNTGSMSSRFRMVAESFRSRQDRVPSPCGHEMATSSFIVTATK